VARTLDKFFQIDLVLAEGGLRFALASVTSRIALLVADDAACAPAAAP